MEITMKNFLLIPAALATTMALGCTEYLALAPAGTTANSKLSVCHVSGKKGKYDLISVKVSAAQAHADHGDFLAPAGAKKNSDCVEPTPTPPTDTIPPVVVPPTDTVPPVVVPPADTVPPVVVPPVVVLPPVIDTVVDAVKELPVELKDIPCIIDASQPQCQL
jgi:hypothetical protein